MRNKFAAFVVGRRSIAVAIFEGLKLSFWQVRSFQAKPDKASLAVTAFVNYVIERCEIEAGGIEEMPDDLRSRAAELTNLVEQLLRERSIPVSTATNRALFASYGHPPISSRAALREIAQHIFPQLRESSPSKELLDAVLFGLYFQTERLLSDY
jgi:hypothetical protein